VRVLIAHLSDIHFSEPMTSNSVLAKAECLAQSITSPYPEIAKYILLLSGDVAQAGKKTEYEYASSFLDRLKREITKLRTAADVAFVVVPGNHDCDLSDNPRVRELVVEGYSRNVGDIELARQLMLSQTAYQAFSKQWMGIHVGDSEWLWAAGQKIITIGTTQFVFNLLNSAIAFRRDLSAGSLSFPVERALSGIGVGSESISISILHHPYNWFDPVTGRAIRKKLEEISDIIFTGHEHVPDSYRKETADGAGVDYVEGGVLQSNGSEESSFNIVIIDLEKRTQKLEKRLWNSGAYAIMGEQPARDFVRNRLRLKAEHQWTAEWGAFLNDVEFGFTHPGKDSIVLRDIFVWPQLKETNTTDNDLVDANEILDYSAKNKKILLTGSEKSGKTALLKQQYCIFSRAGQIPLFLTATDLISADPDKIRRSLASAYSRQYESETLDSFMILPQDKRVLILDDFHKVTHSLSSRNLFLDFFSEFFGTQVITVSDESRCEDLVQKDGENKSKLMDYRQLHILEFGHALRDELLKKWITIGQAPPIDESVLQAKVAALALIVNDFVGKNLLPAAPVFILMLLQQVEARQNINSSGSYGYLYEYVILKNLQRIPKPIIDIDTKNNYLIELAKLMFDRQLKTISSHEMRIFHREYCSTYSVVIDLPTLLKELRECLILNCVVDVEFKYAYLYYYYAAKSLRDHVNEENTRARIRHLSRRLHNEDSACIMLFLSYLCKDPFVLSSVLEAADDLFKRHPVATLEEDFSFLGAGKERSINLTLECSNPESNRLKALRKKDEADRVDHPVEADRRAVDDVESTMNDLFQINAGFKTIKIIGQVVRNYPGSLTGDTKHLLVDACYQLSGRMLGFLFGSVRSDLPLLSEHIKIRISEKKKGLDGATLDQMASKIIFGLVQGMTFALVRHLTESVGLEKLDQTFSGVLSGSPSLLNKCIDVSIKADHYISFPEMEVFGLADATERKPFPRALLSSVVWNHFYLFHADYRQRRRVCEKLNIKIKNEGTVLSRVKITR